MFVMDPSEKKLFHTPSSADYLVFPRHICPWPGLEYLDLANFDGAAAEGFRKYLRAEKTAPSGLLTNRFCERITRDDCRVLFQRITLRRYGIMYQELSGRQILFIYYLENVIFKLPDILESGEAAVNFMHVARRFGYHTWIHTGPVESFIELNFHRIYPSILKGLLKMKSEHPLLVMDFIHMVCKSRSKRLMLFSQVPDREHLEFILDAANKTKFDFWGFRVGLTGGMLYQIIHAFLEREGYDLVSTLIRYGFTFQKKLRQAEVLYTYSADIHNHPENVTKFYTERELIQNDLCMLAVSHLKVRNWVAKREFEKMYRTIVLSLPYPRESMEVIRKSLQRMFPTIPVGLDWNMEAYTASPIHPISRAVGQPVALSELCICALRERLRENFQLPQGVYGMGIPTLFKGLLNLEEEATSPEN